MSHAHDSAIEYLEHAFTHFAGFCADHSPLYAELATRVALDRSILELALRSEPKQPPVNLLFGAVHYLVLAGVAPDLSAFYPSVGGFGDPRHAWLPFEALCRSHRDDIVRLVGTRRVQTNEVGRCGALMPAIALASARCGSALHLVEVGASAGLNLLFDRYRYDYGDAGFRGEESPVLVRTELRGEPRVPLPHGLPEIRDRVGVDITPVDVTDSDAMRWVEALMWPDDTERIERQRAARILVANDPPRLVEGNAMDVVPALLDAVPQDVVPCVYHSHAIYQMTAEWRATFAQRLDDIGRRRDLAHVSLEWLTDDPRAQLHLTVWRDGTRTHDHLAECDHHGRWIRGIRPNAG